MRLRIDRRTFLAGTAVAVAGLAAPPVLAQTRPKVCVLGAGTGGAVAARTLRRLVGDQAEITVVIGEDGRYHPPFNGTSVMLGRPAHAPIDQASLLVRDGLQVVQGRGLALDRTARTLLVEENGARRPLPYDLLIAAPGVELGSYGEGAGDPKTDGTLCWTDSARTA